APHWARGEAFFAVTTGIVAACSAVAETARERTQRRAKCMKKRVAFVDSVFIFSDPRMVLIAAPVPSRGQVRCSMASFTARLQHLRFKLSVPHSSRGFLSECAL